MKANKVIGVFASLFLIVAVTVLSLEFCIKDDAFFSNEYRKYSVAEDLGMEIEDVEYVSDEMMAYLFGERENLTVYTTLRGEYREFFNEREKDHMVDVKNLLDSAKMVRTASIVFFVACIIVLAIRKDKVYYRVSKSFLWTIGVVTVIIVVMTIVIVTGDFTKYWHIFHEMFFSNDLWLLDPATDMMILMLPEGFFIDLIVKSLVNLLVVSVVLTCVSAGFVLYDKRKRHVLG